MVAVRRVETSQLLRRFIQKQRTNRSFHAVDRLSRTHKFDAGSLELGHREMAGQVNLAFGKANTYLSRNTRVTKKDVLLSVSGSVAWSFHFLNYSLLLPRKACLRIMRR